MQANEGFNVKDRSSMESVIHDEVKPFRFSRQLAAAKHGPDPNDSLFYLHSLVVGVRF